MKKTALLVEFNSYHDEVLPSVVRAYQENGYEVDLLTNSGNLKKDIFSGVRFKPRKIYALKRSSQLWEAIGFHHWTFRRYDMVFINSLEPFENLRRLGGLRDRTAGVIHNAIRIRSEDLYRQLAEKSPIKLMALGDFVAEKYLGDPLRAVRPYYLLDDMTSEPEPHRFVVQGNFDASRRNYESLLSALVRFREAGRYDLKISLIGKSNGTERYFFFQRCQELGVSRYIDDAGGGLSYADYFSVLRKSAFLLPLIEPGSSTLAAYYDYSVSSSLSLAIGLGILPVVDSALAALYGLQKASITHGAERPLFDAMSEALETSVERRAELRRELGLVRESALRKNKEAIEALAKTFDLPKEGK